MSLNFKQLKELAEETSKLIAGFIKGLKGSQFSGHQRKRELSGDERATETFMRDARKELSRTLPHLYTPEGKVK